MVLKNGLKILLLITCIDLPSLKADKCILDNLSFHLSPYHLSRYSYLQHINTRFKSGEQSLIIVGMGGLGKTQLAKEYATHYHQAYELLWWFDSNQDLLPQLRELGNKLNLLRGCQFPNSRETSHFLWIEAISDCSNKNFSSILFILDDVKRKEQVIELIQGVSAAHILLTSRDPTIERNSMVLKGFTRKESIQYLTKALPQGAAEERDRLAETLKDYPLALAQAVSYIRALPSLTLEEYLELYHKQKEHLLAEEENLVKATTDPLLTHSHQTVATTFTLLLEHLKENSPSAYELLEFASFLGSKDIPKNFLKVWMLENRRANEMEFHKALSSLIKLSIFERAESDEENETYFNLHELLQEYIRNSLSKEKRKKHLEELTRLISHSLPESSQQVWKILSKDRYLEFHLESLLTHAAQYDFNSEALLKLKIKHLHFVYFFKFDVQTTEKLIFALEKEVRNSQGIHPLDKGKFLTLLSNFSAVGRSCQEAIAYSEEAEKLLTNLPFQEAREELFFLLANNLMDFYSYMGNLNKAEKAAKSAERLLPYIKDHDFISLYHHIRTLQLMAKGDFAESLKHIDLSIEGSPSKDFLPYVHFFKKAIKAEALAKLGEIETAQNLAEVSFKELKKIYPDEANYKTIRVKLALVFIYLKQGNLKKASYFMKLIRDGLNVFYKTPYESPLQLWSHILLGELYEKQNDLKNALVEYRKAEDVCRHIYKTTEVFDIAYLYKNVALLAAKMKDEHLLKTYIGMLVEDFGFDHSQTIETLQMLDDQNIAAY